MSQPYKTLEEESDTPSQPKGFTDRVVESQPSNAGDAVDVSQVHVTQGSSSGSSHEPTGYPPAYSERDTTPNAPNAAQANSLRENEELEPPPPYSPPNDSNRPPEYFESINCLNSLDIRDSLINYVESSCCYGSTPAYNMEFRNISPLAALHYKLESFTEKRTTCWKHTPYYGGEIDGANNGPPPAVWEVICEPDQLFHSHIKEVIVPRTSVVKPCHNCSGSGSTQCMYCLGTGRVACPTCGGCGSRSVYVNGQSRIEPCVYCVGGRKTCGSCAGSGRLTCHTCNGAAQLKHYQRLQVTFLNRCSDYIHQSSNIPEELIRNVAGFPIFEQTLPQVWPITSFPQPEINANSLRIVEQHRNSWPDERIINQHQLLRSVPISEVDFHWREHWGQFWVFGQENQIYFPDYPHKCCWGCTIL